VTDEGAAALAELRRELLCGVERDQSVRRAMSNGEQGAPEDMVKVDSTTAAGLREC
jgi:hypothetical protein